MPYDTYLIKIDGSGLEKFTEGFLVDFFPDGNKILLRSYVIDGPSEIYMININGTGLINLSDGSGDNPVISSDGNQVAFESARDGNDEIYIVDTDGSEPKNLTNNPAKDWNPIFVSE